MIEEREVITVVLSLFAGVLAYRNRRSLAHLPANRVLVGAWVLLFFGTITSVLEGLIWRDVFNALEHVTYGSCSLLVAAWIYLGFARPASSRRGGS